MKIIGKNAQYQKDTQQGSKITCDRQRLIFRTVDVDREEEAQGRLAYHRDIHGVP